MRTRTGDGWERGQWMDRGLDRGLMGGSEDRVDRWERRRGMDGWGEDRGYMGVRTGDGWQRGQGMNG